jgi:ATP-dependent DNA helicase PIF1
VAAHIAECQLVICGDFCQLPPVQGREDPPQIYAFQAQAWNQLFGANNMFKLETVFRQDDNRFVRILEAMRQGEVSRADAHVLRSLSRTVIYDDGLEPVQL